MNHPKSIEEVSKRINEIWAERLKKTDELSEKFPKVFNETFDLINRLAKYGIVLNPDMAHETSHYSALLKIERNRNQQNSVHAKKTRGDLLTLRIRQATYTQPDISLEDLIALLKSEKSLGVIHDIDDKEVIYRGKGESQLESCDINALRNRLSRAKKQLSPEKEK